MRVLLGAVILAFSLCVVGESNPLPPSAAPDDGNKQSQAKNANTKSADKQAQPAPPSISVVVSPTIGAQEHGQPKAHSSKENAHEDRTIEIVGIVVTAFATIVVAIFTWRLSDSTKKLWEEAKTAGDTAKNTADAINKQATSFAITNRAFIIATFTHELRPIHGAKEMRYWFCPIWINSGNSPTQDMRTFVNVVLTNEIIPIGEVFPTNSEFFGRAITGPRASITGAMGPTGGITPEDLLAVHRNEKFLYLWGWAKYFDGFPDTPERITTYCCSVAVNGDPIKATDDPKLVDFMYLMTHDFNRAT